MSIHDVRSKTDPQPTEKQSGPAAEVGKAVHRVGGSDPVKPKPGLDTQADPGDHHPDVDTHADGEMPDLTNIFDSFPDLHNNPKPIDPKKPGAENIKKVVDSVNQGGDVSQLNSLDNFRSRLTPEQQQQYDAQLTKLRDDPRIQFEYKDGMPPDEALEDLALRGITAANFNNPALLEQVLGDSASDEDGKFKIIVYKDAVPLGDFYKDNEGTAAGLATPSNDIAIDSKDFYTFLEGGDNALVHEFSHLQQRVRQDGSHESGRVPGDFPYSKQFETAFDDPKFQEFLVDHFFGGTKPKDADKVLGNAESWPTVQNLFHQDPEALRKASPEIYDQLSRYFGVDPLSGKSTPPVQLNGGGDPQKSIQALAENFPALGGRDGRIGKSDLENVLQDPNASPELQSAAAMLLSSEAWRSFVDVGAGRGSVDGNISLNDLQGALKTLEQFPTGQGTTPINNRQQALDVLWSYGALSDTAAGKGGRDDSVSENDLKALVSDPGTPPQLRAAATLLLNG